MFKWDQARGQLSPLLYNVYTDNVNHHLHATGVGCYVGGAWVNSLSYADDMVLLAPTVTALQTLLDKCRSYAGPHDIVYNTTKGVYACICWSDQSNHKFGTQKELGSEMRNSALCRRVSLHMASHDSRLPRWKGYWKTIHEAKCSWQYAGQKILIFIYGGKNPIVQLSHIVTQFMDVLFGVIHTNALLISIFLNFSIIFWTVVAVQRPSKTYCQL